MRKVFIVVLALMMVLCLVGCGGSSLKKSNYIHVINDYERYTLGFDDDNVMVGKSIYVDSPSSASGLKFKEHISLGEYPIEYGKDFITVEGEKYYYTLDKDTGLLTFTDGAFLGISRTWTLFG